MAAHKDFVHPAKSDLTRKLEVIKDLQQLQIKEQNLEKEKCMHVYNRHGEFHVEFAALQELDSKSKVERNAESVRMKQHYTKIQSMVKKFRLELENLQPSPQFVEKLKLMMEDIEGQISIFKEQQRTVFEQLLKDERLVGLELSTLEKHVESWSQPDSVADGGITKSHKLQVPLSSARDVTVDLPPEVAAFEKFLQQTGGHRGEWDEYDHTTFLKYRNRFKGKVSFIKELAGFLPTRTEQEIRDHEVWHQDYTSLNEKKKEAIQKWREKKEIEKEDIVARAGKSDLEKKLEAEEEEERRRKALQKEKEEQKLLVNRWKIEKELQKAEEEEKRLRLELEKQKKEEVERQKKMELRKCVDEYRTAREREDEEQRIEEMIRLQAEREMRRQQAAFLISQYRDRDLETVKQKRENEEREKKKIEQEKLERLERLKSLMELRKCVDEYRTAREREDEEQRMEEMIRLQSLVEVNVQRDPKRLLQPTELWKERQRNIGPSGTGPLLHMPRRAVPTWRQHPS